MAMWNDYEKIARRLDRIANAFERIANALETANIIEADRKTEPRTEETEMERLERIDNELEDAWARIRELTDEPQTEHGFSTKAMCSTKLFEDEPQTDCAWGRNDG